MTTLDDLRHFAITRSLFPPTTLPRAIEALGFVQADPIRAPARAQDLTLRPRVTGYRAGDLERLYRRLPIEEDFFINYGFVTHALHRLMHPRTGLSPTSANQRAAAVLAFVREHGTVHPRAVDAHFAHGRVTNYWGGSSSATTRMLEAMHYKGLLRVAGREAGIRLYATREPDPAIGGAAARRARVDALVDVLVAKYAPIPDASLSFVLGRLRYAVPQWLPDVRSALVRARHRLSQGEVDGQKWYWPAGEAMVDSEAPETVRLLAPFDPVVWDGRTGSRRIRRNPNASSGTTRYRCCGAIGWSDGRTSRARTRSCTPRLATSPAGRPAIVPSSASSTRNLTGSACSSRRLSLPSRGCSRTRPLPATARAGAG